MSEKYVKLADVEAALCEGDTSTWKCRYCGGEWEEFASGICATRVRALPAVDLAERGEQLIAIRESLHELAHWPDLPGVPYGVELVDAATGETRNLVLRPEQIVGLTEAIFRHIDNLMPHAREVVRKAQNYDRDLAERLARRDRLWRELRRCEDELDGARRYSDQEGFDCKIIDKCERACDAARAALLADGAQVDG